MQYKVRKIITSFDYPPIPIRHCDWSAVFDDYDGAEVSNCYIRRGANEIELTGGAPDE